MRRILATMLLVTAVAMLSLSVAAAPNRQLVLQVNPVPSAWSQTQLPDKLYELFSRRSNLDVRFADGKSPLPRADSTGSIGGTNGRWLMLVNVEREELDKRKSWRLPFILHRWEAIGIIQGEWRLYELTGGRQIAAEPFCVELKARAAFQLSVDDDAGDPDLHLSAGDKVRLFYDLEDKLCVHLFDEVGGHMRLR